MLRIIGLIVSVIVAFVSITSSVAAKESTHVKGPNGLEGWTLLVPLDIGDEAPTKLIIASKGKVIRQFKGDPFIWTWTFLENGKQIAFETGPPHFSMACVLVNTSTGKKLAQVDCFTYPENPPSGGWPRWVDALEKDE